MKPTELKLKKLYRYESDEPKTIDSTNKAEEIGKFRKDLVVTFLSSPKVVLNENGDDKVWSIELITQDGLYGQTLLTKTETLRFKELSMNS